MQICYTCYSYMEDFILKEINKHEVGARIRLLRSQKGRTLIDLASKLDEVLPIKYNKHGEVITLSDSIISRWENGISLPNKERQKAISEVLGVPLEELLYGKNDNYIDSLIESFKIELEENNKINAESMRKAYDENYQTFLNKNTDYGSSFEESLDEFGEVAGIVRISDKYNRLVNLTKNENKVLESKADTLKDMANYCLMLAVWLEDL